MNQNERMTQSFPLRLPDGLRGVLKEVAARNRRSMNAEAVLHIERGLAAEKKTAPGQP